MMGLSHEQARRSLLTDLSDGQQLALGHFLTCPECREEVASRLPPDLGETRGESPPDLALVLKDVRPLLAEASRRRQEAQRQMEELLSCPAGLRPGLLRDERYASAELLLLLLEHARRALPWAPEETRSLCRLAGRVTDRLHRGLFDQEEAALCHVQIEVLRGNAERLLGRFEAARDAFGRAARFLVLAPGDDLAGGELCRWQGVLCWERGDFALAEGLLRQSARVYEEAGPPAEEAVSRVLLGLLLAERGESRRAVRLLQAGRAALDAEAWPWLAVQSRLGLALEWARLEHPGRALPLLEDIPPEEERLAQADAGLAWLAGRAVARAADLKKGERLLVQSWLRLVHRRDAPLAALCTLDLAAVKVALGSSEEVPGFINNLALAFRDDPAVLELVEWGTAAVVSGELDRLRNPAAVDEAAARTRRLLRLRGHRVLPPL